MPQNMLKTTAICFFLLSLLALAHPSVAQQMQSQQYIINSEDIVPYTKDSAPLVKLNVSTLSSTQLAQFQKNGYTFLNPLPEGQNSFSFSLDKASLSFGTLTTNQIAEVKNNFSLLSTVGSQLLIAEEAPLTSLSGKILPNLSCNDSCSPLHAAPWVNQNYFGLGYSLIGSHKPEEFKDENYFKPLPNLAQDEAKNWISKANKQDPLVEGTLVFKVRPSAKDNEVYSTTVDLVAVPSY